MAYDEERKETIVKLPPQMAAVSRMSLAEPLSGVVEGVAPLARATIKNIHLEGSPVGNFQAGKKGKVKHIRCSGDHKWCFCPDGQGSGEYVCCGNAAKCTDVGCCN
jgi:hypothetical protein